MKTRPKLLILNILILFAATTAHAAGISIPGSDTIEMKDYFKAPVEVEGWDEGTYTVEITEGRLPFGLRLADGATVEGYPAAVEETETVLVATGDDGRTTEGRITFTTVKRGFNLLYRELPVAPVGEKTTVKLDFAGGKPPYGCAISRVETFTAGATEPGYRRPSTKEAPGWLEMGGSCELIAEPDSEAVVLMVVTARDSSGSSDDEFYALRAAKDPAETGWLEKKVRDYNRDYQERFSPYGLTLEIEADGSYSGYGDAAIWTGTYLAGAAYYYAVTGEDYARKNMKKALDATTRLREITGVPGLIARAYENDEWKGVRDKPYIQPDASRNRYEVKEGPYKGWRFQSTASRDQYTGVFWGNGIVYELFDDPELKEQASENVVSMAAHIWDNDMHIMDVDGKPTRHGVMSGYGIQDHEGEVNYDPYTSPARVPNGFNCTLILNWFDLAAATAQDEETYNLWRGRYRDLISNEPNPAPGRSFERNYISHMKKLYVYGEAFNSYWDTVWFNLNLLHNNYFHLVRNEQNDKLREKYRDLFRYLWKDKKEMDSGCEYPEARRVERERNPHFTWQYLAAQGERDPDLIFNALSELMAFPAGPQQPFEIKVDVEIETVPGHEDWACEPIPIEFRKDSGFVWQRNPYKPVHWEPAAPGRNRPAADVITPYWMGRYFGYIPGNI